MIRNNAYYELFASYTVPNPDQVGYWIDLGANSKGKIVKIYNENLRQWVKVLDASSEDAVSPFIGSNGNWWVDNRDTGIPAAGKNPYIGENGNWYVYDPLSKKFVDTGVIAKGRSAYEIAVEHGFQGTEDEWLESLKQPALDAAQVALEAAERANEEVEKLQGVYQQVTDALDLVAEATENANTAAQSANDAADRSNLIASNPPKIVNETWYMFDEETNEYVSTGIKAIGDAFTIIKTYTSVEEMQADYSNPEVGIGQFVMIDTGDVNDPEDSQLYLKGETEWKFISDLSGAQGIQGLSAYQVAVQEGFVGSEEEWVESLSKDSKEAAQLALQAKEQVEQTEQAVKDAEALRVTAESERVAAENTREENEASRIAKEAERVSAEQARVDAENSRVEAENTRAANEAARVEAENARVTAENQRASAESSRVEAEQARVTAESGRVTAEENRESAEETRKQNEEARVSAESSRVTAEQQRVTQEEQRQKNIQTAIRNTETAVENTNVAIANAEAATENANTQADRAKEFSDNPPKIQDNFWYIWDEATDTYVNTNVQAKGEKGDQGLPGESYTLPIASSTTLGGIKVGAGLQINAETGVLNATGGGTADAVDWENITSKPDFSAVATSGDYNDLINTPDIPDISNLATKDEVALKANSSDVYTKSETYTKTETDNAIKQASATVFKYKGTVDSFDFLPTLNVSVGDVYTLADTNEEYVATTASPDPVWEYLGVKVDLSDYSTTAENDAKYQPKGDYITEIPSEYVTEDELTWDIIDGKPTTLAGYGITDALSKTGTAAAASKLSPGCKIWGQAFTGESDVSGNMTGVGSIDASGEIRSTYSNAFRAIYGDCGFIIRNDSKDTYFMLTDSGNQYGLYNSLRPFIINNSTGNVYIGNGALFVQHGGNTGFGTSSPQAKLHVVGDGRFDGNIANVGNIYMTEAIRFTNNQFNIIDQNLGVNVLSKQSGGLYIQDGSGGNVIIGARGTNNIEFWGGQTSSVSSGSKLGEWTTAGLCIGGASHDAKLHVIGNGLFTDKIVVNTSAQVGLDILAAGETAQIRFGRKYSTYNMAELQYYHIADDSSENYLSMGAWGRGISERLYLKFNGKFGVGTNNPQAKLHVVGDGLFTGEVRSASANAFRATYGKYGFFVRNDGGATYFMLTNEGDNYGSYNSLRPFRIDNSTGEVNIGNSALVVKHEGNVGIGTASPQSKLQVDGDGRFYGNVTASKFIGTSTNTEGALGGNLNFKKFSKNDNSGYPTFVLIADCTDIYLKNATNDCGFVGYCIANRVSGFSLKTHMFISAFIKGTETKLYINTNTFAIHGIQETDQEEVTTYSDSLIKPCIVKYNDKYYVAFKCFSSGHDILMYGNFKNCLSTFTQLNCPSSSELPSGLTIMYDFRKTSIPRNASPYIGFREIETKKDELIKTQTATTGTLELKLDPNSFYRISNYTTLNITLDSGNSGYMNEYMFEFTTGSFATTLNLPDDVKWMGGSAPTIKTNKTYQVSIVNNLAVIGEF